MPQTGQQHHHCKTVLAAHVANPFLEEIRQYIATHQEQGKPVPTLVAFLANTDPAAQKYAEWTAKTYQSLGLHFRLVHIPRTELEDAIVAANTNPEVHGIMVYYPVFGGAQDQYLQNIISPSKDVEGLCHLYRYNMYHNIRFLPRTDAEHAVTGGSEEEGGGRKCIIPCTPLAIVKILEHMGVYNAILPHGNRLYGKVVTIVNRSEVVGRPLAALLANDGAKVYSVDLDGVMEFHRGEGLHLSRHEVFECALSLEEALRASDVVISGVPSPAYQVPTQHLKDGVVAINFSTFKNFDEDTVRQKKASLYVGSVGKVTVAMLSRNLLRLHEYQVA